MSPFARERRPILPFAARGFRVFGGFQSCFGLRAGQAYSAMTTDHIFIGFMGAVGIAAGAILIAMPETRDLRVPPYFWVLIAMALFEITLFAFFRGVPGRMVSNGARILGFVLAVVIMIVLPIFAGSPGRLF
jgi:hypothetical protein